MKEQLQKVIRKTAGKLRQWPEHKPRDGLTIAFIECEKYIGQVSDCLCDLINQEQFSTPVTQDQIRRVRLINEQVGVLLKATEKTLNAL